MANEGTVLDSGTMECGTTWQVREYENGVIELYIDGVNEEEGIIPWQAYTADITKLVVTCGESMTGFGICELEALTRVDLDITSAPNRLFSSATSLREVTLRGDNMSEDNIYAILEGEFTDDPGGKMVIGVSGSDAQAFAENNGFGFRHLLQTNTLYDGDTKPVLMYLGRAYVTAAYRGSEKAYS